MQIGFIGLGKMGSGMTLKLLEGGHEVAVWNRSKEPIEELKFKIKNSKFKSAIQNLKAAVTIQEFVQSLNKPRVIWLMLPAGEATQSILNELSQFIARGDIVIDGGNSYYKDTQKRYQEYKKRGIHYLGIGVSGGIAAAKNGYPLMVGGDRSAYQDIASILSSLSKPNGGYGYFGQGGAGHFAKMVHNGIEYAMMQAMGEGFAVLKKSEYNFDLVKVSGVWRKGSIVAGFLLDRALEIFERDRELSDISGKIPRGGEGDWTVEEAERLGIDIPAIKESVDFRRKSEKDKSVQGSFTARMINALRNAFGGHHVYQT